MPELDGTMQRRIATLERRVEDLARTSERSRAVLGNTRAVQQVRTAKTWSDDPATYPSTGNTFGIIFQDIAVTLPTSPGSQTVTRTNRTTLVEDTATSLDGAYLPRGEYVAVIYQAGHWWIIGSIREGEALVSYKEWDVTFDNSNAIGGEVSHPASVANVEEAGTVGVSWDDGAKNWEVTTAGVLYSQLKVRFRNAFHGGGPYTHVVPAVPPFTNDRSRRHVQMVLTLGDGPPGYDALTRDNFSKFNVNDQAWIYQLNAATANDCQSGNRIMASLQAWEHVGGVDREPQYIDDEYITSARLLVCRFNDATASVALPGPLTYYRFDDSDNTRVTEDGTDDRITE